MIGIVIVSHSARLAEAVCEMAGKLAGGRVPLAAAGGFEGAEGVLGTDPVRIQQAIEAVYSDEGVLVLMDIGSALISAEMALEFLPEEQQARVYLCEAPLIEGAVAAAIQAGHGATIEQVVEEARNALGPKAAQLAGSVKSGASEVERSAGPPQPEDEGLTGQSQSPEDELILTVHNKLGLHARPAARLVETAGRFQADITLRNVTRKRSSVNAKSINQVMILGVRQGHEIGLAAKGPDAGAALAALEALVRDRFGETDPDAAPGLETKTPPAAQAALPGELPGLAAVPGIAIGPLIHYQPTLAATSTRQAGDPEIEWDNLQAAVRAAGQEIETLRQQYIARSGRAEEAAIFTVHLLSLEDPALLDMARSQIFEHGLAAEVAWQHTIRGALARYRLLEDPYLRARGADVTDIGQRVLRQLTGAAPVTFELSEPAIVGAVELMPSDVEQLDPDKVIGVCTALGSPTAHSTILIRALGIPTVVGLGPQLLQVAEGTLLALDGRQGRVWVKPDNDKLAALQQQRAAWLAAGQAAQAIAQKPARTRDGRPMPVMANIRSVADAGRAVAQGAEGVGLLRTEFLFLNRSLAPSEEEQREIYEAIAQALGPRPLIIRTLDAGGDKPLPYLGLEPENNPFLGWRGIRISLERPDLLKSQLRAILRASPGRRLKIMFPLIASLAEVRMAKALLAEVQASLRQEKTPFDETIAVGLMIETPAAVAIAGQLAGEVDFFSLGVNDLSQYVMAADRTNARVAALADPFQPAVLRLIQQTVEAAHAAGIGVGLCGEFAADPLAAPLLIGLKLDELSVNGLAIPQVKQAIAQLTTIEAEVTLEAALQLESGQAVRQYITGEFPALVAPS